MIDTAHASAVVEQLRAVAEDEDAPEKAREKAREGLEERDEEVPGDGD